VCKPEHIGQRHGLESWSNAGHCTIRGAGCAVLDHGPTRRRSGTGLHTAGVRTVLPLAAGHGWDLLSGLRQSYECRNRSQENTQEQSHELLHHRCGSEQLRWHRFMNS
jgi:hypothetical protein